MIETTPKVYLIAEPVVLLAPMLAYLRDVGGEEWYERVVAPVALQTGSAGATQLVEFCGRLCYRSWRVGLNRNVTKIRENTGEYLMNVLMKKHGSVIEHAHFTFVLRDVSRVLTAEWNRHRHPNADGWNDSTTNISEQSLRYVRLDNLRFRMPPVLPEEVLVAGSELLGQIEAFLEWAAEYCGLDNEGDEIEGGKPFISFDEKKVITSALRRFAPMGLSTDEVWTANLRDIRHVLSARTDAGAEEEVRIVANRIGEIMDERMPYFFQDYTHHHHPTGPPAWVAQYEKV